VANPNRPIAIDLFAGAGGLSLAFEQAGFDLAAAVELDPIHAAVHEFNFPNCATICDDVSRLSGQEIRIRAGLGKRKVHVVCGGAPCQGFSMIGKRALEDPRNRLVGHFARIVSELDANYFVFENVKGLTVGAHRQFLEEVIQKFDDLGYNVVTPYHVLNAAEFGVPQDRRRLFLLGAKKGLKLPEYPERTTRPAGAKKGDLILPEGPSVWDALADLPEAEDFEELLATDSIVAKFKTPSRYARVLRGMANDPKDFSYRRKYDRRVLTSSLRAEHTDLSRRRFAATPWGETEPVSRFHKLHPDGVCNTLRAGTASDRGAFTSPRPIHPHSPRCITVREAARLHGYPDWFRLHVTKWHGFRQIGNSVPPMLGRAVATKVIEALGIKPTVPEAIVELGRPELLSMTMAEAADKYGVSSNVIAKRQRLETPKRPKTTSREKVRARA
jgi:DNA (cytosine-5)-methyltransferase 1